MNSPAIYIEISGNALRALQGEKGIELALERTPGGALTDGCRRKVVTELQSLAQGISWSLKPRAFCAIGSRGVSLRRFTVPAAQKEEFQRMLLMQIESEFPLPPDQLAWGCRSLSETRQNGNTRRELLVVAVKKDVINEYSALLSECGFSPVFTLAAFARAGLSPKPAGSFAILDVGEQNSELALFENGVPLQVRILPFAESHTTSAEADGLTSFAKALNGSWSGKKLFVIGSDSSFKAVNSCLTERFTSGVECEPLAVPSGKGHSSAVVGLKKSVEAGEPELLFFESQQLEAKPRHAPPAPLKWATLAAALVLAAALLPYLEALVAKPFLERKLARLKADEGRLAVISKELGFLQQLKNNQPPYLDALYLVSKSAPQGSKIDTLTMNRHGEMSLRGSLRNADQVADFRNKLIGSGFFANVSVEEQTPTPDKQKLNVRIAAQWKPLTALQTLAVGPTPEEIEKAKNKKESPGGMPMGMPAGMPMGMPAGMPSGIMPPGAMPPGAVPAGLPPGVRISLPPPRREGN